MTARKLITAALSEKELKELRKKDFLERNKIIQDKLARKQRIKMVKLKGMKEVQKFVF